MGATTGDLGHLRSRTAAKLVLIAAFLSFDHAAVVDRVVSLGLSVELLAYVVLYALLAVALVAAAFVPSAPVRLALAAALATGSFVLLGYEWSTSAPLVYDSFETMVASRGDAADAMRQHGGVMLQAAAAALVLFAGLALPPRGRGLPVGLGWWLPAGAVAGLACLLYMRGGEGARALPAPFSPLAQGAIMAALRLTDDAQPRQPVRLVPGRALAAGDIVLIVDESVAARYLDINHRDGVRSGLAEPTPGVEIANFGVAAAVTNCSAGSNRTLRFGGTRESYREAAETMPSIWAYAHRAGLRTVYLDGQRTGGALQNLMSEDERREIDAFVQLDGTPVIERDHALARRLAERLDNGVDEFILVNKVGAHFPVAAKFPVSAARFAPLPDREGSEGIGDLGAQQAPHAGTPEAWRLYRNAYRNTLLWGTRGFFARLLPHVAGSGAVLIYTSDHGQDLHERGGPGESTHCVPDPRSEEGAVPLVLIDANPGGLDWRAKAAANFNGMSHFRIFPSLLGLMGYSPADTAAFYGPSLASAARDPMSFTSNYFATLGRRPRWRSIDPAALAAPPRSDFAALARAR